MFLLLEFFKKKLTGINTQIQTNNTEDLSLKEINPKINIYKHQLTQIDNSCISWENFIKSLPQNDCRYIILFMNAILVCKINDKNTEVVIDYDLSKF